MTPTTEITRPALRYYGGKWRLAPWIISHFPPHRNYVEPCGGAASVLLQKPRSPLETYNDLDGNVVNFFRVLRDRPDELIRKIRLTPWARDEYELSLEPCEDEVERARRFLAGTMLSISGMAWNSGFRCLTDWRDAGKQRHAGAGRTLESIADRLMNVQIESDDYKNIIARFDGPETLFYFDPPYIQSERVSIGEYVFEWSDPDHIQAAGLLRQAQGYVIVSGYACPLYTELYELHGWQRVDKESQTNSGGKRIESLWLSPRTVEALHVNLAGLPLFDLPRPTQAAMELR